MVNKRMENWDPGDFCKHFRREVQHSTDETFKERINALAEAIEPLDREFCEETVRCGRDLSSFMEELESIGARMGYCSRPRGFDRDCETLYRDVDKAIDHVQSLREACFI